MSGSISEVGFKIPYYPGWGIPIWSSGAGGKQSLPDGDYIDLDVNDQYVAPADTNTLFAAIDSTGKARLFYRELSWTGGNVETWKDLTDYKGFNRVINVRKYTKVSITAQKSEDYTGFNYSEVNLSLIDSEGHAHLFNWDGNNDWTDLTNQPWFLPFSRLTITSIEIQNRSTTNGFSYFLALDTQGHPVWLSSEDGRQWTLKPPIGLDGADSMDFATKKQYRQFLIMSTTSDSVSNVANPKTIVYAVDRHGTAHRWVYGQWTGGSAPYWKEALGDQKTWDKLVTGAGITSLHLSNIYTDLSASSISLITIDAQGTPHLISWTDKWESYDDRLGDQWTADDTFKKVMPTPARKIVEGTNQLFYIINGMPDPIDRQHPSVTSMPATGFHNTQAIGLIPVPAILAGAIMLLRRRE